MVLKAMLTVSMASLVLILSDNLKETIFLAISNSTQIIKPACSPDIGEITYPNHIRAG